MDLSPEERNNIRLTKEIKDLTKLVHRNASVFQIELNFLADVMAKHGITFSRAELNTKLKELDDS